MAKKKAKTLKKLREFWYAKLKKKGFVDIEQDERRLKGNMSSDIFTRQTGTSGLTQVEQEAKRDYYLMATHFLNTYPFESKLDEVIWAYHTEAISERDIVEILNKVRKKKLYKLKVGKTIRRLKALMKKQNGVIK